MGFPLDAMKLFPLGGCATCGVNVEVRPGCRLCRECLVIADVIYDEVRREEHRARGGSDGNYHIVDPEARWPVDENGVGPFGWRSDKRAAVGVTCNVCRRQPEALQGLRMCRSCMELAAGLINGGWKPPTQNPLPADPPQVPENTSSAEPPADPTQNDPIASACLWCQRDELRACLLEALEHNARSYGAYTHGMRTRFTNAIGRKVSPIKGCSSPSHWPLDPDPGPAFNHTRGDSPLTPCPICAKAMGAELGREIGRVAVEAAEAAEATCVTCGHRTENHITTAAGSLHCWCGCKNFGLAL